jgi:predicted O-linked N-acetylglucosamine transferase (SPINDLY family)
MKSGKHSPLRQTPLPDDVEALLALYNGRRYAEAESRTRALLGQYPDFGFGWKLLGGALQMQGKDALPAFQKVTELMPDDAEAHYNLGVVLKSAGRLEAAAASYRRAVALQPEHAEAHGNLGNTLKDLGQLDAAVASYRRAIQIKPGSADAHNNLGTALKDLGQLDAAVASYRLALQIKPDFADAHYNLGNALKDLGQLDAAVTSYRRALQIKPDFVLALINLGTALKELHQFENSIACYRKAVEIKPDFAEAHGNIGSVLKDLGQLEDAVASHRRALEIKPDYVEARSNLLFALNYTASHASSYCLAEAREYGRRVSEKVTSRFSAWQCSDSPQRLRVGIVSGDLNKHPVGYALKSLLEQLDSARVEFYAYPTGNRVDEFTALIKPYFASWKPLYDLSDAAAARLIHADGVHVLLDLSGHTAHNRLPMFAWKPAPVQASWLGYFATTGVAEMDYLLMSEAAVPKAHREHFTETVWYLPDTWLCFTPPEVDLPVTELPALKNGYITFGCFQRLDKLGEEVLSAWANIFNALLGAQLRMACKPLGDPAVAAQFVERLRRHGIDPARVAMSGAAPSREVYLTRYAEVDVMLDSFPYPGVTTTCEALWMGVPTLTIAGDTLLSRQGTGVLAAAGMENWVATSVADYADKAVALAGGLPKLAALRAGLRAQVLASPLFDAPRFARNFEAALWGMWQAKHQSNSSSSPERLTAARD